MRPLKPIRQKTNVEFVVEAMEYSRFGALKQAFIVEALGFYCDHVLSNPPPEIDDTKSLVSPKLWYDIAVELRKELELKYGNRQ
jgi:hypothetical protein